MGEVVNCERSFVKPQQVYTMGNRLIKFSNRQAQCINLLACGMSIKEIAKTAKLSPRTVEAYLEAIKNKLGCRRNIEIIVKILAGGLHD